MTDQEVLTKMDPRTPTSAPAKKGEVKVTGKKYILLTNSLASWGKVPQQQSDLAKILGSNLEVDREYTEQEVFDVIRKHADEFPSIRNSVQDPTYLFRYYRGLKNDGKHAGFIARDFLKVA